MLVVSAVPSAIGKDGPDPGSDSAPAMRQRNEQNQRACAGAQPRREDDTQHIRASAADALNCSGWRQMHVITRYPDHRIGAATRRHEIQKMAGLAPGEEQPERGHDRETRHLDPPRQPFDTPARFMLSRKIATAIMTIATMACNKAAAKHRPTPRRRARSSATR